MPKKETSWSVNKPTREANLFYFTCMTCLLVAIAIASVVVILLIIPYVRASGLPEDSICEYVDKVQLTEGVRIARWIGYPRGWEGMPSEWDYETYTPLIGDTGILTRGSGSVRWLWFFRSLTEDNGNHDFCPGVLIIDDKPSD